MVCPNRQRRAYDGNDYKIATAQELQALAMIVNNTVPGTVELGGFTPRTFDFSAKTIQLTAEIDLKTVCGDGTNGSVAASWVPIGSASNNFKGTFDGKGKTISNLAVTSDCQYSGLFGYADTGATLKDFTLSHATIKNNASSSYCGFIVAESDGAKLTGLTVSGNLKMDAAVSASSFFGGIAGYTTNCSIVNCAVTPNHAGPHIRGTSSSTSSTAFICLGGIAGKISNSQIVNCFSTADVKGEATIYASMRVGGVCGDALGTVNIFNSYSSGMATFTPGTSTNSSDIFAGGLTGLFVGTSLSNCYALGAGVTNTTSTAAPSVGRVWGAKGSATMTDITLEERIITAYKWYVPTANGGTYDGNDYKIATAQELQALAMIVNNTVPGTVDLRDFTPRTFDFSGKTI